MIQQGHMTPFGTSHTESTAEGGGKGSEGKSSDSPAAVGRDGCRGGEASSSSGLRLCSEGFDGLFEVQTPPSKPAKKMASSWSVSGKGKGKENVRGSRERQLGEERREEREVGRGRGGEAEVGEGEEEKGDMEEDWIPTKEEMEWMSREVEGDWREDMTSTEYSTDEELGPGTCIYMYVYILNV